MSKLEFVFMLVVTVTLNIWLCNWIITSYEDTINPYNYYPKTCVDLDRKLKIIADIATGVDDANVNK